MLIFMVLFIISIIIETIIISNHKKQIKILEEKITLKNNRIKLLKESYDESINFYNKLDKLFDELLVKTKNIILINDKCEKLIIKLENENKSLNKEIECLSKPKISTSVLNLKNKQ